MPPGMDVSVLSLARCTPLITLMAGFPLALLYLYEPDSNSRYASPSGVAMIPSAMLGARKQRTDALSRLVSPLLVTYKLLRYFRPLDVLKRKRPSAAATLCVHWGTSQPNPFPSAFLSRVRDPLSAMV